MSDAAEHADRDVAHPRRARPLISPIGITTTSTTRCSTDGSDAAGVWPGQLRTELREHARAGTGAISGAGQARRVSYAGCQRVGDPDDLRRRAASDAAFVHEFDRPGARRRTTPQADQ